MRYHREQLDDFSGASGFGKTKTLHLSPGPVFHELHLFTNVNNDQIEQVEVKVNGDAIYDITGDFLRKLEAYKKRYQGAGIFVIPFSDLTGRTQDGQHLTGLVTLPGDNITVKVKFAAATQTQIDNSTVPEVTAVAVTGNSVSVRETLPRMYRETIDCGSTGKISYKNFNRGPRIRRMHIEGDVSHLEIKRDKKVRFGLSAVENTFSLKRDSREPQAGYFHFDPLQTGFLLADMLQTAGASFEINPTMGTAGDFEVVFETVERIEAQVAQV